MTAANCPCCGQAVEGRLSPERLAEFLPMSPHERQLFTMLAHDFGRAVPTARLVAGLYHDDPDGGPLTASRSVLVRLSRLRRLVAPYGLRIVGRNGGRGGGGTIRLFWAEEVA